MSMTMTMMVMMMMRRRMMTDKWSASGRAWLRSWFKLSGTRVGAEHKGRTRGSVIKIMIITMMMIIMNPVYMILIFTFYISAGTPRWEQRHLRLHRLAGCCSPPCHRPLNSLKHKLLHHPSTLHLLHIFLAILRPLPTSQDHHPVPQCLPKFTPLTSNLLSFSISLPVKCVIEGMLF